MITELLKAYRYKDVDRFLRAANKTRTYIYYDGKLIIRGKPKPSNKVIDLGAEAHELGELTEYITQETPLYKGETNAEDQLRLGEKEQAYHRFSATLRVEGRRRQTSRGIKGLHKKKERDPNLTTLEEHN